MQVCELLINMKRKEENKPPLVDMLHTALTGVTTGGGEKRWFLWRGQPAEHAEG